MSYYNQPSSYPGGPSVSIYSDKIAIDPDLTLLSSPQRLILVVQASQKHPKVVINHMVNLHMVQAVIIPLLLTMMHIQAVQIMAAAIMQ